MEYERTGDYCRFEAASPSSRVQERKGVVEERKFARRESNINEKIIGRAFSPFLLSMSTLNARFLPIPSPFSIAYLAELLRANFSNDFFFLFSPPFF